MPTLTGDSCSWRVNITKHHHKLSRKKEFFFLTDVPSLSLQLHLNILISSKCSKHTHAEISNTYWPASWTQIIPNYYSINKLLDCFHWLIRCSASFAPCSLKHPATQLSLYRLYCGGGVWFVAAGVVQWVQGQCQREAGWHSCQLLACHASPIPTVARWDQSVGRRDWGG